MNDVTVICCYNNEKVYGEFVKTLEAQTCKYDLIGINNVGNKTFKSCANAYNSVINQVKTKYVIYSHQDILLNKPDMLEKFVADMRTIQPDDIIGVAGMRFYCQHAFMSIIHYDKSCDVFFHVGVILNEGVTESDTLDECFFGGYTEHFRLYPFDEVICNNWHLYAVEACLRTKSKLGGKCWVSNSRLIHLSRGSYSPSFYWGFYRLCRKYAKQFPLIRTTCVTLKTDKFTLFRYFLDKCIRKSTKLYLIQFLSRIKNNFLTPQTRTQTRFM